jgi:hypothetical protein
MKVFFSIMALNRLKECLVAHQMAFAQIYQLNGQSQYGIQASIVNILANVDKMQTIIPQPTTCESIIVICIKNKLEYKSPYLSSYVQPKVIMKTLHDFCHTPIYKEAKVSIKVDWANLFESNKIIEENAPTKFVYVIFNKDNMD